MQHIRKSQVTKIRATSTTTFMEFFFQDKRLGGAYIEINGRYPDTGYALNKVSCELAFIIKGSGVLATVNNAARFSAGDSLFLPPLEKFYWNGKFTMYVVTSPAFDPKQHTFTK